MNIAIISSAKDIASSNIKEALLNNFDFKRLEFQYEDNTIYESKINKINTKIYTINSDLIHKENIDGETDADLFLFISKHMAKAERKTLTVHPIGNFGKAEFGGKEKELCVCPAAFFKGLFNSLTKNSENSGYEATVEATHHGPFLEKPVLFIEVGSTEKEWADKSAAMIVAKSIIGSIDDIKNKNDNVKSFFIIGGSHYNHVANKLMLKDGFLAGHICGKHNLEILGLKLIKEAMEKTMPKPDYVLLDWKGLGKEKQNIVRILEENNIKYVRSDKLP